MPRLPKRPRVPELYRCANPACTRMGKLDVRGYSASVPAGISPELVHHVTEETRFTIMCSTCGHYTVAGPYREPPRSE